MKKQIKKNTAVLFALFAVFIFPSSVFAAPAEPFKDFIDKFNNILTNAIPIIIGLAVIFFFWGVINFIRAADQPEKRAEGRSYMMYSIISIFVILSFWGLVNLVISSVLGGATTVAPDVPQGPFK